jgi:hypothetical protein
VQFPCKVFCTVRRSPVRDDIIAVLCVMVVVRRMANHNDNQIRPVRGSKQRKRKRRVEANARGPFGYSHAFDHGNLRRRSGCGVANGIAYRGHPPRPGVDPGGADRAGMS